MKANYMTSRWRIPTAFVAAAVVLVGAALVLEHREAVDLSAASYGWGSDLDRNGPAPPNDMVLVPAGEYVIGDDSPNPAPDARPRAAISHSASVGSRLPAHCAYASASYQETSTTG